MQRVMPIGPHLSGGALAPPHWTEERPQKHSESMAFEIRCRTPGALRPRRSVPEFRNAPALHSKNFIDRLSREDKNSLSVDVPIHIGVTNFYWRERMKRILLAALITSFAV